MVNSVTDPDTDAFVQGLRELGYEMGRDFLLEIRGGGGNVDLIPGLIADVIKIPVDLIVTTADPVARAAKAATTTIPILMAVNAIRWSPVS